MIILTNPSTLELVLGSSVTTSQLPYYIAYVDSTSTTHNPLQGSGVSNDTTIVTVLSTPIVSTIRTIKYISIHNKDTTSKQVFLQINDTVNTRTLVDFTLDAGDRIEYTDTVGFRVISSLGEVKTVSTGNSITPASLTKVDDTNVTLTLGGSPTTALLQPTSLTLGWTGTLADARIASAATWNAKQAPFTILSTLGALADASGVLTNNGAGVLSWGAAGGSQTPWTSNISAAGYTLFGNSTSGGNLTLASTSNATKGKILFGTSAYDEVNNRLGIGTATPLNKLDVYGDLTIGNGAGAALKYNSTVAGGGSEFVIQPIYSGTSIVSIRPAAGSSLAPALRLTDSSTDAGGSHAFSFGTGSASLPANAWNFFSTITGNANTNSWPIYFGVSNPSTGRVVAMTIDNTTNVGIGTISPTAVLHLKAGTATANTAPLKFTTGTNTTVAVAGQIEYNNTFHLTNSDATRRHIVTAPNTTKVTASAPYTNDGYIVVNIAGTDFKILTTA